MNDDSSLKRPDPEALLARVQADERAEHRGQLKIFLGYAPGVGKSFRLFDEARRRRDRGEDVVVAAMQPTHDEDVDAICRTLEIIPTRDIGGVPVIDVDAVLARRPHVCIVDGLAYDNPPGSRHAKRYQDVDDCSPRASRSLTSLNLEVHRRAAGVSSRRSPAVERRETVPQAFMQHADEVVIVDAPPEAATRNRPTDCRSSDSAPSC